MSAWQSDFMQISENPTSAARRRADRIANVLAINGDEMNLKEHVPCKTTVFSGAIKHDPQHALLLEADHAASEKEVIYLMISID